MTGIIYQARPRTTQSSDHIWRIILGSGASQNGPTTRWLPSFRDPHARTHEFPYYEQRTSTNSRQTRNKPSHHILRGCLEVVISLRNAVNPSGSSMAKRSLRLLTTASSVYRCSATSYRSNGIAVHCIFDKSTVCRSPCRGAYHTLPAVIKKCQIDQPTAPHFNFRLSITRLNWTNFLLFVYEVSDRCNNISS